MVTKLQKPAPLCIPTRPDANDEFWKLFNPWQFLKAQPAEAGERPDWRAVKKYPVAKRLAERGWVVAVRPSSTTTYIVIDIDFKSRYHPNNQPYAIELILQCFEEELGLCSPILIRSSDSGGIHVWYWFSEAQNTYQLADAAKTVLQRRGFIVQSGHLELFPNCKTWVDSEKPQDWSLYNALRVPFQEPGSFILDRYEHTPVLSTWIDQKQEFVRLVEFTKNRNTLDAKRISSILSSKPKRHKYLTATANQYFNDLLTKVNLGWTGHGQTQQIFFDVTRLLRIFGHILLGCEPLWNADRLAKEIYQYVLSLPERQTWCKHNHELEKLSERWAIWVQKTKYKPYGRNTILSKLDASDSPPNELTWNQKKLLDARERIREAFNSLLSQSVLPATVTARANALAKQGISFSTLYRHPDLWHPKYLDTPAQVPTEVILHSNSSECLDNRPSKTSQDEELQSFSDKESFTTVSERVATTLARLQGIFAFGGSKGGSEGSISESPKALSLESDLNSVSDELPQERSMPDSNPQSSPEFLRENSPPDSNLIPPSEHANLSQYQSFDEEQPVDLYLVDWEKVIEEESRRKVEEYLQECIAENSIFIRAANPGVLNLEGWYWSLILDGESQLTKAIKYLKGEYSSLLECYQKVVEADFSETEDLQELLFKTGSLIPRAWGGDWDNFPAEDADTVRAKRLTMALDEKYYMPKIEALMKISFLLENDFLDVIAAVDVRATLLNWTADQLRSFISDNFRGKTRQGLTMFELVVLLYDLEIADANKKGKNLSWTDTDYSI